GRLLDGRQHQVPASNLGAGRGDEGIDGAQPLPQPLQALHFRRKLAALPCRARSSEPNARCCRACTAPTDLPMMPATWLAVRSWKNRRIRTCCCSSVRSRMAACRSSLESCSTAKSDGSGDADGGACSRETSATFPCRR